MRKLFSILIISTALMGCTNSPEEPSNKGSLEVKCYSRGYNDDYNVSATVKEFSMYVMNGHSSYDGVSNPLQVVYSNDKWNFNEVKIGDIPASIYAICPQTESSLPDNIPISLSPLTDYIASEKVLATKSNPIVNIEMSHILAKVNVNIDGNKPSAINIKNQPTKGTYSFLTGVLTPNGSNNTISGSSFVYIFPSTTTLNIELVHNGKTYKYNASSKEYLKGKEYNYNLKLDDSGNLSISGEVIVNPWQPAGDYEGSVQL